MSELWHERGLRIPGSASVFEATELEVEFLMMQDECRRMFENRFYQEGSENVEAEV